MTGHRRRDPFDGEWRHDAACRTDDAGLHHLFFAPPDERPEARERREEKAREICAGCPVGDECRRYALHFSSEYGIWAGIPGEVLLRRRRLQRSGNAAAL